MMLDAKTPGPSPAMVAICACLAVVLAVGLVLSPVLTCGLVNRDDTSYVDHASDGGLTSFGELRTALNRYHYPRGSIGYYQPMVDLTLMFDAWATGDSKARAFFFHLTNLGLHLANVALVFMLVRRLSRSTGWAVLLAGLFGLHPAQVETVAWVSQRMTLLGTLFSLAALHYYIRYAETGRVFRLAQVLVLFVAAVLSKPMFIALPIVFLILDYWPLERLDRWALVEKVPFALPILGVIVLLVGAAEHATLADGGGAGATALTLRNLSFLAQRLIVPLGLSPLYPGLTSANGTSGIGIGDILVVGLVVLVVGASLRHGRPLFAAVAGCAAIVLPALINQPFSATPLGDQYLYAALVPPIVAMAAWLSMRPDGLRGAPRGILAVGLLGLVVVFGVMSHRLTDTWRSGETYFLRVVETHPRWILGYAGLIDWHLLADDDQALGWARRAIEADPDSGLAHFCLGTALLQMPDRAADAVAPLRKALESDAEWVACLQNLGTALARTGDNDEAARHLERARDLRPRSPDIRIGLGYAYLELDRPAEARAEFQRALKRDNSPLVYLGLARAWAKNDNTDYARRHLFQAIRRDARIADRAAQSPELSELTQEPEYEALIREQRRGPDDGADLRWQLPTAGTNNM